MNRAGNKTFSITIYDYFLSHWFLSSLIAALPLLYFIAYLAFSEKFLDLVQKSLPDSPSHRVFILLTLLSFVFILAKNLGDKYNDIAKRNGQLLFMFIQKGIDSSVEYKLRKIEGLLLANSQRRRPLTAKEILDPKGQVDFLIGVIHHSLSKIFGMPPECIGISIIFKLPRHQWQWFVTKNIEGDLSLEELTADYRTTASHVINENRESIFYPNKLVAIEKGEYLPIKMI